MREVGTPNQGRREGADERVARPCCVEHGPGFDDGDVDGSRGSCHARAVQPEGDDN